MTSYDLENLSGDSLYAYLYKLIIQTCTLKCTISEKIAHLSSTGFPMNSVV